VSVELFALTRQSQLGQLCKHLFTHSQTGGQGSNGPFEPGATTNCQWQRFA